MTTRTTRTTAALVALAAAVALTACAPTSSPQAACDAANTAAINSNNYLDVLSTVSNLGDQRKALDGMARTVDQWTAAAELAPNTPQASAILEVRDALAAMTAPGAVLNDASALTDVMLGLTAMMNACERP